MTGFKPRLSDSTTCDTTTAQQATPRKTPWCETLLNKRTCANRNHVSSQRVQEGYK